MLLAIDLGNTNTTFGLFSGQALLHIFRSETRHERTSDEYAVLVRQLLSLRNVPAVEVEHAIIASVVPSLTDVWVAALRTAFDCEALVVGRGVTTGIAVQVENPDQVGADRIVNVVAARATALADAEAWHDDAELERGAIVIDFGTATTFDCLSPRGEFLGGAIVPGVRVCLDGLIARTAQLPAVELVAPPQVLGRNTGECLQSGIVHGYASLVDGLVAKLKAELAFECSVVATGGLASLIAKHTVCIEHVDPELTLRGLQVLHGRNKTSRAPSQPPESA
jgi:type III pantothenate kinase